jgi:hypothetical protein
METPEAMELTDKEKNEQLIQHSKYDVTKRILKATLFITS